MHKKTFMEEFRKPSRKTQKAVIVIAGKVRVVKHTVGLKAKCPYCHYQNDAARVDYCRHCSYKRKWGGSLVPHTWIFRRDA